MALFRQDYTKPDAQVARDNPLGSQDPRISVGTTGPYPPAKTDPSSYRQKFVTELSKNPPAQNFYSQVFSAKDAQDSQGRIDALGSKPIFPNSGDNTIAYDFLKKYKDAAVRKIMLPEEQINQDTIGPLMSQQPGEGIGNSKVTVAGKLKYAGSGGTKVS